MEATIMNPVVVIKKLWDAWDARVMILLSLFLQIILFILGNRRKYLFSSWIQILCWLAYLGADWVAIAALGKLSSPNCQDQAGYSAASNVLSGLWAPLLLVHLGGPDTITAYALEDNKLVWRHLLGTTVQAALAIYVIVLSWTSSWLSILSFPLFLAGIIKCIERTWCLYQANNKRQKTPLFDANILGNITTGNEDLTDAEKIVLAQHWFAIGRPDMNNYFSTADSVESLKARLAHHMQDIGNKLANEDYLRRLLEKSPIHCLFDIVAIQSGFMFDMLYTKAAIIYTKLGCVLCIIRFSCSLSVFFVFFISFTGNWHGQHSSREDIFITGILLVGAVALEIYSLFVILSSDWALLLRITCEKNRFIGGIFQSLRWLISRHDEKKMRSRSMGQFDFVRYCISFSKRKPCKLLTLIGIDENLRKLWHKKFEGIDPSLREPETFPLDFLTSGENINRPSLSRGQNALQGSRLISTVLLDFDHSITIWHIATYICYHRSNSSGARITCKRMSDYMMYLLVMKPSMVSSIAIFWFGSFSRNMILLCKGKNFARDDATVFLQLLEQIAKRDDQNLRFINPSSLMWISTILEPVHEILSEFDSGSIGWDKIKSVWMEMFHYAAVYCPHDCHLEELKEGGEFLTLHRLMLNYRYHQAFLPEFLTSLPQPAC